MTPVQPAELDACRRCALWAHATHGVAGEGPAPAALMLVGEQPGNEEDLRARPFVGPAGALLDAALAAAGLERSALFVTNAVKHFKWQPRGQRRIHKTPAQKEVAACATWLEREIAVVQPRVIVALGATALRALLGGRPPPLRAAMTRERHRGATPVLATYHPSYVLRLDDADRAPALGAIVAVLRTARERIGLPLRE